jgi:hypothetical protein
MRLWDQPESLFARSAIAVAAIVCVAPAFAQNTTSAITGRVVDGNGRPVSGATVAIRHVDSGSTTNATTDGEGRYAARGLRPGGPYTIVVTSGGRTERQDNISLALAETLALETRIGASEAQQIVITGRAQNPVFARGNPGAGTALTSRDLAAYASVNRNLQDYARIDPRLAQTDKERGEVSAAGQNTRYNSITIDGVTINDTFGLESNNLPTAKQPISIEAIQSVQVNISNYDASQKGYTGANVNAVTKSGTNEFKGSVYYVWRDETMVGKRFNRQTGAYFNAPAFQEYTTGFTLGGPILKDKLFFFANYEELKSSRTSPNAGPIGSSNLNVAITQAAIDNAIAISRNSWGFDAGTAAVPGGVGLSVKDTLLKLDFNATDSQRGSVRYNKTEQNEPFFPSISATGSTPSLSLSSHWYDQIKEIETLVGQWFSDWTDNFSTEVKVSKRDYASEPLRLTGPALPQVTLRFSGALPAGVSGLGTGNRELLLGTERSRHFNVLRTETTDAFFGGTLNLGDHELKAGVDLAKNDVFNAFLQDTNGQYRFQCENTTATLTYTFNAGAAVNCVTADAATVQSAVLENYQRGRFSNYVAQLPRSLGGSIDQGAANWSYENRGAYLQDTWRLSNNLSFVFGVRVDQQDVPTKPLRNAPAAQPLVAGNGATNTAQSGGFGLDNTETLDGSRLVQPRFGFNWKPASERRMQLRGGFGLFQGAAANVWLSNPFSNTGVAVGTLQCTSEAACSTLAFSANPPNPPRPAGQPPAGNVDFLSPELEQPSVWKANLAFEMELPPLPVVGSLVAGVEWLHTKTNKGIYYENLNLGAPTLRSATDGRPMFYNPLALAQTCWNGQNLTANATCGATAATFQNRALRNTAFGNVLVAKPTSKGGGDVITLSLQRPATQGFGWGLAYTRTTAKEVNPLTSSTSISNWSNRNIFDPNEEVLQNSNYLIRDRVGANVSWSKPVFSDKHRTTVGLFYEGRRGKPYSWTFNNDLNGDGFSNDLMYIPRGPGSGEVVFRGGATEEARFWEIVNNFKGLSDSKGGIVGRNTSFAPWVNSFDVRVSQELPGFAAKHKATVSMDILNVGNLLNNKWGRIDEIGFPSNRSFVNFNGMNAQNQYIYSLTNLEDLATRQERGESQWAVQITLKYEF